MKKLLFLLVALSLLWVYQADENPASAHGGTYRGPAGEVPPGQRDPKDPQPPPENPGTGTPGPGENPGTPPPSGPPSGGGEEPPPGDTGRPSAPAPGGPTGGPPGGGTATPGAGRVNRPKPMSFENWLFWWNYNKDELLNLKAAVKSMEDKVATDSSTTFFGEGLGGNKSGAQRPTEQKIQTEIIPALEKTVANKDIHPDIRGGAVIALARCRGGAKHLKTFFDLANPRAKEDKVVRESAMVAIGIAQVKNDEVRDWLIKFVDNTDDHWRVRCFAMLTLGLLRDNTPEVFECLERRFDGSESTADAPVAALMTMGLIGDAAKVPDMVKWLEAGRIGTHKLNDLERAHLVSALGKIGDPQALKVIEKTILKKGIYTKRSAYIAYGQIVPQMEPKTQFDTVKRLAQLIKNESDTTGLNFGVTSLGRIAGQDDVDEKVRGLCVDVLHRQFTKGNKTTERPYAALALGLVCFESGKEPTKPKELKYKIADLIYDDLKDLKGDKVSLGAQAIALGLIGDSRKDTTALLAKILEERGYDRKFRGAAAIALGLIGDRSARDTILKALEEREDRDLRVDTAVAAGLLGDTRAVKTLVDILNDPKASQFVLGSVALALGQIGDHRAIGSLLKILDPGAKDGTYPDMTRALVSVAIGQLADRSNIRVLSRVSKDVNYRASVAFKDEYLTIL